MAINKNISSAMVRIARMLPRQPHLRSPSGSLSDNKHNTSPMNGVNNIDSRNVQPNPMRRLAPTSPTNAARKVSDKSPKTSNVSAMGLNVCAKVIYFSQKFGCAYENSFISPISKSIPSNCQPCEQTLPKSTKAPKSGGLS